MIVVIPAGFKPNPELAEIIRQIEDPQDLNEALLSVRVEEAGKRIAKRIQLEIEQKIIEAMR